MVRQMINAYPFGSYIAGAAGTFDFHDYQERWPVVSIPPARGFATNARASRCVSEDDGGISGFYPIKKP
jgi:hypothetical protein